MSPEDLIIVLEEMANYCEGAMMAGRTGGSLRNFSFCIQERLRNLVAEIKYEGIEDDDDNN